MYNNINAVKPKENKYIKLIGYKLPKLPKRFNYTDNLSHAKIEIQRYLIFRKVLLEDKTKYYYMYKKKICAIEKSNVQVFYT